MFGELQLTNALKERQITIFRLRSNCRCKVLTMGRDAFERLMGPAEEVLKKEVEEYEKLNHTLAQSMPLQILAG